MKKLYEEVCESFERVELVHDTEHGFVLTVGDMIDTFEDREIEMYAYESHVLISNDVEVVLRKAISLANRSSILGREVREGGV